jgi:protein O-GlcNAc transferase
LGLLARFLGGGRSRTATTEDRGNASTQEAQHLIEEGSASERNGQTEAAMASYRRALELNPDDFVAHNCVGNLLCNLGRAHDAMGHFRAAIRINPDIAALHYNLGNSLKDLGQRDDAVASYRRALEINPDIAVAHCNLGGVLADLGNADEAVASYRRSLEIDPGAAITHLNLGNSLKELRQLDEAVASYLRALEIDPGCVDAHTNIGDIQKDLGQLHDAVASQRRALQINPASAAAHNNLGNALKDLGRFDDAIASYRKALEFDPGFAVAHSNLLLALNYSAGHAVPYCVEQAREFGRALDLRAVEKFSAWQCSPRPERLRVGLVSGDFRSHPVGFFLAGPLAHVDPARVELIAYSTADRADALTDILRPHFAEWTSLAHVTDDDAARLIHDAGVHILVDLSGHTANNRLPVFARRPAPVQCSWLGYFATTGVAQMDHLLGDPFVTPAEEASHFTENVWRLPECYLCFAPPALALNVGPLPAMARGHIVFGCFNNLAKMNDAVVTLWARLLQAVPGSQLLLKTAQLNDFNVRETTLRRFAALGVASDQLLLEGSSPRSELLAAYDRVDIALDPFPYPGGTTSVEAMWMGVPVVTRRGDRFLSHVGESIARNAGQSDWIAADDEDYLAKAVAFATNLEQLAMSRANLRQQVLNSPVFDAPRFARHFENAMWGMWESSQARKGIPP